MKENTESANWEAPGSAWAARRALPCRLGSVPWEGIPGNLCSSGAQFCSSDPLRVMIYSRIGLSNFLCQSAAVQNFLCGYPSRENYGVQGLCCHAGLARICFQCLFLGARMLLWRVLPTMSRYMHSSMSRHMKLWDFFSVLLLLWVLHGNMSFKIFCDHVVDYPELWSTDGRAGLLKKNTPHLNGQANLLFHGRHRVHWKHDSTEIMLMWWLNTVCNSIRSLQEEYT